VDSDRQTPLHLAAAGGHLQAVVALLQDSPCQLLSEDRYGMSPWHLACESGNVEVVRLLLDRFSSHLTARERRGTAHFLALRNECHDVVRLLEAGEDGEAGQEAGRGRRAAKGGQRWSDGADRKGERDPPAEGAQDGRPPMAPASTPISAAPPPPPASPPTSYMELDTDEPAPPLASAPPAGEREAKRAQGIAPGGVAIAKRDVCCEPVLNLCSLS